MINQFVNSTKSMAGKLALFFIFVSCAIGFIAYIAIFNTLQWTEDEVVKKRIILDSQVALSRYQNGETGKLKLDFLTDAYNDFSLVPKQYLHYVKDKKQFLEEVGEDNDSSRMIYLTQYKVNAEVKPLILLSRIGEIELNLYERATSITLVLGIFSLLLTTFTLILMRLSKSLISPINTLSQQLKNQKGDTKSAFTINNGAAIEFTQLTHQLNHYRTETNSLIEREQIFARYASHELRTPITIIKGANDLLQRRDHNTFQSRQLKRIKDAANQMATMVDALLGLVKYERDSCETPLRTITKKELQKIIDDNCACTANKQNCVDLIVHGEPKMRASTAIVSMIAGNLIRNAISATDCGKIEVHLEESAITVLDEGSGLQEQPFQEGHGLGLLLVEDLCNRYGWHFILSNHPEKGCIAKIVFS